MTRAEHFDQVAIKWGTDKSSQGKPQPHSYMGYYAKHLPLNPRKLLEIGCAQGKSLRMWRELFPNCELHTLDLFEEFPEPTDIEGVICHKGNQSDVFFLKTLPRFDVIIDDGSHNSTDINTSFYYLWMHHLVKNGLYVIEDLHCLKEHYFRRYYDEIGFTNVTAYEDTIAGRMVDNKFPHRFDLYEQKIAFIYKD